jgi:hypothetical protein
LYPIVFGGLLGVVGLFGDGWYGWYGWYGLLGFQLFAGHYVTYKKQAQ